MGHPTLGRDLKITATLFARRLRQINNSLDGEEFTLRQGQIIHFLSENGGKREIFQRDIEVEFAIRRPTATGILQLMEKNGLLLRQPVPQDARLKKLILTPKAHALNARITSSVVQLEAQLVAGISPDELEVFRRILGKMRENLEK